MDFKKQYKANFEFSNENKDDKKYVFKARIYEYGKDLDGIHLKKGGISHAENVKIFTNHETWRKWAIGKVYDFEYKEDGIYAKMEIEPDNDEEAMIVSKIKKGLIDAVSVGGQMLEREVEKDGTVIVTKSIIKEVSLVNEGANAGAKITEKSLNKSIETIRDVESVLRDSFSNTLAKKLISICKNSSPNEVEEKESTDQDQRDVAKEERDVQKEDKVSRSKVFEDALVQLKKINNQNVKRVNS